MSDFDQVFETVFPIVFPFLFIGMWCFVSFILSHMSGWRGLAKTYHYPGSFDGTLHRWQSGKVGLVSFSSALEIGGNRAGLYVRPFILFRLFLKPLLISWQELDAEPFKMLFLFKGQKLTIKSHPRTKIVLYGSAFEKICERVASDARLQLEANRRDTS